jgi:tetratricopeptide (TPR) repeat protein
MKAGEQHKLKTNELAEWIFSLPQQIKENLQTIIYSVVIIIVVAAAAFYYLYQKNTASVKGQIALTRAINAMAMGKSQIVQAQMQGIDISYNLIQTADELDVVAQGAKSSLMAALALIKRAEALRIELHYRPGSVNKETLTAQINLAKASYNKAIEKAAGDPSLTATAKFGLGLCEEELGNFTEAEKIYHEITSNKGFEGTIAAAQAKHRLETMNDYKQPVTFKPAPQPPAPLGPRVDVPVTAPTPAAAAAQPSTEIKTPQAPPPAPK